MARGPAVAAASARAWSRGARAGAAGEPPPRGRRRRDAAAVRGRHGRRLRRDDRGRRRRGGPRRARRRPRPRTPSTSAQRVSSRQEEKAARATYVVENAGTVRGARDARWPPSLPSWWGREHPDADTPPDAARAARRRPPPRRSPCAGRRRRAVRRRRIGAILGVAALVGIGVALLTPFADKAVREITLPLRHEDIIRQQAADKDLDPALIAAVIYAESRFRDGRPRTAGAQGLMQITPGHRARHRPQVGRHRASRSRTSHDPQVNIAYGAYYLRYLLDRYGGERDARARRLQRRARATSTAGSARRRSAASRSGLGDIPFPETRAYVGASRASTRASYGPQLPAASPRRAAAASGCGRSGGRRAGRPRIRDRRGTRSRRAAGP